jgi:glycosyltransferase involved in cell wall biosynthesis
MNSLTTQTPARRTNDSAQPTTTMRLALISATDPEDVTAWSGTPHFVANELRRQAAFLEVIAPLSRRFKYLYAFAKLWARLRRRQIHQDRHPLALASYARQIKRGLAGKHFDAILCMSSVPIAALDIETPIFFWADGVLECLVNYYPGIFTGLSSREIAIGHRQEQASIDRCARAIYSSDWAAAMVRTKYKVAADKLAVIEFGANFALDDDRAKVTSFIRKRLQRPLSLLFVGVDWERKGGPIAWEATRQLNERGIPAVLKVVGCDAPQAPFVERLGFISKTTPEGQERLKDLFAQATFFLFPTRGEASAIVFGEASSFGLPVLSTDTGGVKNYVINGQTGYCLPMAAVAKEYADAIQQTWRDPSTYRRLSIGSYEHYEQRLNWRVGVGKVLELIASTMNAGSNGS